MSWKYLFGNGIGTSHVRAGTRCQDEVAVATVPSGDGQDVLAIFVCDGAGSATQGGPGAEIAVQASLDLLERRASDEAFGLTENLGLDFLQTARDAIEARVSQGEHVARDYACTYLALLSSESLGTLVVQLGDGGIVLDWGDGLTCVTEPMNGEYANSTKFLTEEDFRDVAQIRYVGSRIVRAAVFSDGLQSLGVNQGHNAPHESFFRPFFEALEATPMPQDDDHPLQAALGRFLQSDQVNERTDDDKTLALAVWTTDGVSGAD